VKKIFIASLVALCMLAGQTVIDGPGTHNLWSGTTLKKNTTLTSNIIHTGHWSYLGIWVKSTQKFTPDSIDFRLWFKGAMAKTDTFAYPSDTLGADSGSTIMRLSDTLWHYRTVQVPVAPYTKILATSHATDHGDSSRIWVKLYLWRPGYWYEFQMIDE